MNLADATALVWVALVVGGLLAGFCKTAFAGFGTVAAVCFALVLPTRASTGAILPLLIVGDVFAVSVYRRHADWKVLARLLPSVVVGLLVGVVFLAKVDDLVLRRTLGVMLLVFAGLQLVTSRRQVDPPRGHWAAAAAGTATGFSTMIANAAGPVASLYLLLMRATKLAFVGTTAWLFFLINLGKLPFSVGLGLVTAESLRFDALLLPTVLVGAIVGVRVLRRVPQLLFERITLALSALAAVVLLVI